MYIHFISRWGVIFRIRKNKQWGCAHIKKKTNTPFFRHTLERKMRERFMVTTTHSQMMDTITNYSP